LIVITQDSEMSPTLPDVNLVADRAKSARIIVVGDVMCDHYISGRSTRISPEAPVPVVAFDDEYRTLGGAGNVARNLRALGATVSLFGVTGNDTEHVRVRSLMEAGQISGALLQVQDRCTTVKTRVLSEGQQIVRIDREDTDAIDGETIGGLFGLLEYRIPGADAVLIADYGKGVVTPTLLAKIRTACERDLVWLGMDPKPTRSLPLHGLPFLKPNLREARVLAGVDSINTIEIADVIREKYKPKTLLITMGEQGMLLCDDTTPCMVIGSGTHDVVDVCGAGDTVFAAFALATVAGLSPVQAARYASLAASITIRKVGPAVVSPGELSAAIDSLRSRA